MTTEARRTILEGLKLKDLKAKNYLFQTTNRSILETQQRKFQADLGFYKEKISGDGKGKKAAASTSLYKI